ncbi:hypothetical protein [Desulfosporosinus sp. BICA1-9]|uniref:hypothetical protein n=1 Tax=Desulfosporosinus sp. BICA1-9 TaxID=1531958 RepID=UPI000E9F57DF|nr:hypothetical protein [Desulfosporosinus sp. BICA1-9]HBW35540.1 hypothetical protein [Desulfosporosinus sp.]
MASYALLAIQEQYRQLEKPVLIEQLTKQLYKSYHPHHDKGKLRVKADDIQQNITAMNDQLHMVGIRTLDDKQKLISSYLSLALNCVKTHIFIDLEGQEQEIIMQQISNLNQTNGKQVICEETSLTQYNLS